MTKRVFFFLTDRLNAVDSYVPVAIEIKDKRPEWEIRFISFSAVGSDFLARNKSLYEAMTECGDLYVYDLQGGGRLRRILTRLRLLVGLGFAILSARKPALLMGQRFSQFPYSLFYLMARLRGGVGGRLAKGRSTDDIIQPGPMKRIMSIPQGRPSRTERLFDRDMDLNILYHRWQVHSNYSIGCIGFEDNFETVYLGLPQASPLWIERIARDTTRYAEELKKSGINFGAKCFTIFPAKPDADLNLSGTGATKDTFAAIMRHLKKHHPDATVFVRLHPIAQHVPFFGEIMDEVDHKGTVVSLAHPEVLINLSDRIIVNGPTNILGTSFVGKFIDIADYSAAYRKDRGAVSLAEGYGTIYVDPTRDDFETEFERALTDDGVFADDTVFAKRRQLIDENPLRMEALLSRL